MKVVILAAGRGLRMGALTDNLPKPLLKIKGKTLLEHKLDLLPPSIEEIIMIVSYLGSMIEDTFGTTYKGIPIRYIQSNLQGTAQALFDARKYLKGEFIVMAGDDLYHQQDIQELINSPTWIIQVSKIVKVTDGGSVVFKKGKLLGISEGRHSQGYLATSLYKLDDKIFKYKKVAISAYEYGLPQTIASAKDDIEIRTTIARVWIQIGEPGDLTKAEEMLVRNSDLLLATKVV